MDLININMCIKNKNNKNKVNKRIKSKLMYIIINNIINME
jgi:hypothetical protein